MAYLLDSNLLIYSAMDSHEFLRPLALDTQNFASVISKVETLGLVAVRAGRKKGPALKLALCMC